MADFGTDLLAGDLIALTIFFIVLLPLALIVIAVASFASRRTSGLQQIGESSNSQSHRGTRDGAMDANPALTTTRKVVILLAIVLALVFLAMVVSRAGDAFQDRVTCDDLIPPAVEVEDRTSEDWAARLNWAACEGGQTDPNEGRDQARHELAMILLAAAAAIVVLTAAWLLGGAPIGVSSELENERPRGARGNEVESKQPDRPKRSKGEDASAADRLRDLRRLYDEDLISQEQFDLKQREILESL